MVFFENLGAVIDLFSGVFVASEIGHTAGSFLEGWVVPRAGGGFLSEGFGVGNGADELLSDLFPVFEFSPVDHLEAGDTDPSTCGGEFRMAVFFPSWISGDSGQGMETIGHEVQVGF